MTEESVPVKKGRGRPKKNPDAAPAAASTPMPEKKKPVELPSDSADNDDTTDTEETGSPPPATKSPAVKKRASEPVQNDESEPAAKRGRGRPRKANKGTPKKPSGRGRGRPKKNP